MIPNDKYGTCTKILCIVNGIVNCIAVGVSFIMVGIFTQVMANDLNCKEGFVSFFGGISIGLVCGSGPVATPLVRQLGMRVLGSLSGLLSFSALLMLSISRSKLVFGIAICVHGFCIGTLFSTMFVVAVHVFPIRFSQVNAAFLVSSALGTAAAPLLQICVLPNTLSVFKYVSVFNFLQLLWWFT
ncbi:uncharacterized protein LOC117111655 isoform X2 [Anneissia japonica]|uniref:uncharacterized protein LOC117111655 isoform X2 n=1 Tax=Anneissia japonica TaxID=1529436 RepID=UPI00142574AE|nr:uncharacterized protein LOC117111655 isoform X2 [Anneissia japonica]